VSVREGYAELRACLTWCRVMGELKAKNSPVVILHGGPGASHDYTDSLKNLVLRGRGVIQYDQLGCGRSTHLRQKPKDFWTIQLYLDGLDNLLKTLGIAGSYHIVGQSWDRMLGAEHAIRQPKGLRALVIADSPPSIELWVKEVNRLPQTLPPDVQTTLLKHKKDGTPNSSEYNTAMQVFYDRHVYYVKPMSAEDERSFAQIAYDLTVYHTMNGPSEFHVIGFLKGWKIISQVGRITAPTLLISGRHDEATPALVQAFFEGIAGARWEIFEESSHMPHVEEQERCLQIIGDFLAEHDRPARRSVKTIKEKIPAGRKRRHR
jgi:L-proline amide hydrolase